MANLSVSYMKLNLKSPLILGSCGLTNSIENLLKAEKAGFGAVVLKSVFEEQIKHDANTVIRKDDSSFSSSFDYISQYQEIESLEKHFSLIRKAKKELSIPVMASINCFSSDGWTSYAKSIEESGADALEVNYFLLPTDFDKTADQYFKSYITLIENLKKCISIPIALKTSSYMTDLAHFMQKLSYTGIDALALFNRFVSPDINLDTMEFTSTNKFSTPVELSNVLRWIGILSGNLRCSLSATTGCHDAEGMIKLLLAGADTVQASSIFYKNGIEYGETILQNLSQWMKKHHFASIDDFKGKMSYKNVNDPSAYFRIQFMKHMSGIE
ncbi:MAG: dihydroorotate dehydrogenase-like protein [Bacteroidales bacterium]|jgi:dihydroorotate dehydrogenase (fumarate)|nr:dihydroorotate dehydrogenase-like protein [Bacteroidales bacterium]